MLPKDPMMLFSFVNTKLRDEYSSLDALCDDMNVDREKLEKQLAEVGFEYNPTQNKFWRNHLYETIASVYFYYHLCMPNMVFELIPSTPCTFV